MASTALLLYFKVHKILPTINDNDGNNNSYLLSTYYMPSTFHISFNAHSNPIK